jgi:hypothetical protein
MNQRAYKDDYGAFLQKLAQVRQFQMSQLPPAPGESEGKYTLGEKSDLDALQTQLHSIQSQLYKKLLLEEFTPDIIVGQEGRANNEINDLLRYPNEPCVQERLEKLKEEIKYIQLKKAVLQSGLNEEQQRSILNYLSETSLPQYVIDNDEARDRMYAKINDILYPEGGKKSRHKKGKKNKKRKTKKH